MSSRSPCWTRWIPRVTSSAIARSVSSKHLGLSSSLMAAMIAPEPAREIKELHGGTGRVAGRRAVADLAEVDRAALEDAGVPNASLVIQAASPTLTVNQPPSAATRPYSLCCRGASSVMPAR